MNTIFKGYSKEQFARIVSIIAVILGVTTDEVSTTIAVIGAVVTVIMQVWTYFVRLGKGDLTAGGFRK